MHLHFVNDANFTRNVNDVNIGAMTAPYHHGNLRNALIDAAVEAAMKGGPGAIVLQHAAKSAGVSAAAAYRHFPDGQEDLVNAVAHVSLDRMAEVMNDGLSKVRNSKDPATLALRRFRAVGRAYVDYALQNSGLFATSCIEMHKEPANDGPYAILLNCLEELEETGVLDKRNRSMTDIAAWSAVHGLAVLLTAGPLQSLQEPQREAAIERTLDMVAFGLSAK
jgi:AcrR family transcriptional regulator